MRKLNNKKLRVVLFNLNPHCHWCGIRTKLTNKQGGTLDPNEATIDHFRNRMDPLRNKVLDEPLYVLACYKCNQRRGLEDQTKFKTNNTPRVEREAREHIPGYVFYGPLTSSLSELLKDR